MAVRHFLFWTAVFAVAAAEVAFAWRGGPPACDHQASGQFIGVRPVIREGLMI